MKVARVEEVRAGRDSTQEVAADVLRATALRCTADPAEFRGCTFFVVAVPTPM